MSLLGLAPHSLPITPRLATVARPLGFMLCMILSGMYQDIEDSGESRTGADPVFSLCPQRQRCWGYLIDSSGL